MDKTGRGAGAGMGDRWIKPGDWELGDIIDTIPYDTGLETPLCACSFLVVPEVLKRH